jgi:hypothetical protein
MVLGSQNPETLAEAITKAALLEQSFAALDVGRKEKSNFMNSRKDKAPYKKKKDQGKGY